MHFPVMPAFGLSVAIGLFATITMALPTNEKDLSKKEPDVYDIMSAMAKDNNGIVSLGADGVLRSICPNLTVLAYEKLSSQQIEDLIDGYGRDDHLSKAFEGVDGHDVVDQTQLMQGNKDFLPLPFPSDHPAGAMKEIVHPPTSKNHARDELVNAPLNCPAVECYSIGNCGNPHCHSCYVPYPGYAGRCH